MKKIISIFNAVIVTAVALTGCNGNSTSSSTSNSSSSSNTLSGNNSNSSSHESSSMSSFDESGSSSSYDESNSSNNTPDTTPNDFGLPLPVTRCGQMVAKALAADEWGAMMMLETDDELSALVSDKLSFDMLEDGCFISNLISVHLYRVFIAKPKAGSESAVKTAFDERFDYLKNDPNAAFYGMQLEAIEGGVSGVTDDGYYYIVIHQNGAEIADAMVK